MKQYLLIGFICLSTLFSFSQERQKGNRGGNGQGRGSKGGMISGKLIDKESKEAIPFANIILYNSDSTFSKGSVSGIDGAFRFAKLPPNQYTLEVFYVGYKRGKKTDITISKTQRMVQLKPIALESDTKNLDEVEIRASSATVEYRLDKKVINPQNSISATGGNATDILRNAPSVDVDIEGNVSLRGSEDFHVLINGRPTVLTGSDALKQIPSESIKNIEIITNPSVKYAPDGTSGIINIVTKKNKLEGFSGKVSTNLRTTGGFGGDLNLGYKTGKFNFFLSGNFRNNRNKEYEEGYTQTPFQGSVRKTIFDGESKDNFTFSSFEGGVDYELNDNNVFTLSVKNKIYAPKEKGTTLKTEIRPNDTYHYEKINDEDMSHRSYATSLIWSHTFDGNKDHNLQTVLFVRQHQGDISNINYYRGDVDELGYEDMNTSEDTHSNNMELKIDYTRPIGENTEIEAGIQSKVSFSNTDYESYTGDDLTAYKYNFRHNVHAVYASIANSNAIVDIKAGLRAEYTDRNINIVDQPESYPYEHIDLYPSIHISRQLPADFQIQASYSKRVNRPRPWRLNPFPVFSDELTARTGNPELKPEYINSVELGIQKRMKRNYLSLEAFYNSSNNAFSREFYYVGDIQYSRPTNLDTRETYGVEFSANIEPFRWWSLNASGSVYNYSITGNLDGQSQTQNDNSWYARVSSTFKVLKSTFIEVRPNYRGKRTGLQSRREPSFSTSVALKQFFLKKKLVATVSVRDVFQTANRTRYSYIDGLESKNEFTREAPIFSFNVSYLFNNFKKKRTYNGSDSDYGGYDE